ncbi:MAG: hypothetical protein PHN75_00600 [Syntrophales bacterium]|nr:hypothetical protein [Syntrophales bacterium]
MDLHEIHLPQYRNYSSGSVFAGWNIKPGMIASLVDQSVPLCDVLSATTLPDYLSMLET